MCCTFVTGEGLATCCAPFTCLHCLCKCLHSVGSANRVLLIHRRLSRQSLCMLLLALPFVKPCSLLHSTTYAFLVYQSGYMLPPTFFAPTMEQAQKIEHAANMQRNKETKQHAANMQRGTKEARRRSEGALTHEPLLIVGWTLRQFIVGILKGVLRLAMVHRFYQVFVSLYNNSDRYTRDIHM